MVDMAGHLWQRLPDEARTVGTANAPAVTDACDLRRKWGIRTPEQVRERCRESGRCRYLVESLVPTRSIGIFVGDSGIGKSPFLYQAAMCVAVGQPFLGGATAQGRVLYLDFENGIVEVADLLSSILKHLNLSRPPDDLLLWNFNDALPSWSAQRLPEMVADAKADWVIIDSLSAFAPEIEEKSKNVTQVYQDFRRIIRTCGTAITVVHHLKKPSNKPEEASPSLEENPHSWLLQARGSRALINGCDVRIGIDRPTRTCRSGEIAFVIGGFGRVRGTLPTTYVSRVLDDTDEPLGYNKLTGAGLLFNSDQEQAFHNLPHDFRFKDARMTYGRQSQATADFLRKCGSAGIVEKCGNGHYRKLEPEQAD